MIDINDNPPFLVSSPIISIPSTITKNGDKTLKTPGKKDSLGTEEDFHSKSNSAKVPTHFQDKNFPKYILDWEQILKNVEAAEKAKLAEISPSSPNISANGNMSFSGVSQFIKSLMQQNEERNGIWMDKPEDYIEEDNIEKEVHSYKTGYHNSLVSDSLVVNLTFSDVDDWAVGHGPPFNIRLEPSVVKDTKRFVDITFNDGEYDSNAITLSMALLFKRSLHKHMYHYVSNVIYFF